jgi:hypothetical protein
VAEDRKVSPHAAECAELHALVLQAWELRDGPYLREAVEAIVAWHERRPLTRLERRQAREAEARAA